MSRRAVRLAAGAIGILMGMIMIVVRGGDGGVRVRAATFDVMMMRPLRRADRGLVPDDPFAVLAQQAVHVDVTRGDALDPLHERIEDERVVVEITGLDELDLGVPAATTSVWA